MKLDSENVTIGGASAGDRNVISANQSYGILTDATTPDTVIQGNYIGTDATGTLGRGNLVTGVGLFGTDAVLGGSASSAGQAPGNVISDNGHVSGDGTGVFLSGTGAVVQGNIIGLNAAGTAAPNAAQAEGIYVTRAGNLIGEVDPHARHGPRQPDRRRLALELLARRVGRHRQHGHGEPDRHR